MDKELTFFWEILPGTQCNLKCKNCYAANNARPDHRLLGWDNMKDALDKAITVGMKTVNVLGGEPLAYKHLGEFVEYFTSKSPDGFCGVVSNGTLLTGNRARLLADSGLSQISISLDGTVATTNDANRGRAAFHQALAGVENAVEAKIPLTIAYTVTQFNLLDAHNVFSFAKNLGAEAVGVQITEPFGRSKVSLAGIDRFSRIEGLKAICQMYHTKPPLYTETSSKTLFQEFLNRFFNAGLSISPETCDGGLKTFMVSSGGDLYPCSEYAYFPDGRQRYKGVNLVTDDLSTIEDYIKHKYAEFNHKMRSVANKLFTTCEMCEYWALCAPCPMINPPGKVPECEWVQVKSKELTDSILRSKLALLIEPVRVSDSEIGFPVATQEQPLLIPMSKEAFIELATSESVFHIVDKYLDESEHYENVADTTIKFLCTLRSHHVIEIEGFKAFLDTELSPLVSIEKTGVGAISAFND